MTTSELNERISAAVLAGFYTLKKKAPRRTGNLQDNSLSVRKINENTWAIRGDTKIAPYFPYTTEPWLSKRWNRKKNPNQGWWDKGCKEAIKTIAAQLNSEVKRVKK